MAKRAGTRMQGWLTVAATATLTGAVLIAPRVSIVRREDATIIKYNHLKPKDFVPAPAEKGLIITPSPKPPPPSSASPTSPASHKPFSDEDWILDTGAMTHVCTNRTLLHSYTSHDLSGNKYSYKPVAFFGPNAAAIVGNGNCTLALPSLSPSNAPAPTAAAGNSAGVVVNFITIKHVSHIPTAGLNLISWSQLKRARGLNLRLVEDDDGSLIVRNHDQPVMRFELRNGLYFLVQMPSLEVAHPADG
ncbi:hypothetical protein EDD37DRAFT_505420 [Exophiala viscosa]|uniref:Uncharacterized protein n=1 Tax=Exophiala viscosa TaxID=2486360 RepID=A0AAN6IF99_9EURO|nr:hypothetical protein EDD36DRAFT_187373 [Exophiala viscosa]KAI1622096.1 hypothetical protein EDD37DRAFT_505420 [Exophiala viscosa]